MLLPFVYLTWVYTTLAGYLPDGALVLDSLNCHLSFETTVILPYAGMFYHIFGGLSTLIHCPVSGVYYSLFCRLYLVITHFLRR
jgi:hypothetical protein